MSGTRRQSSPENTNMKTRICLGLLVFFTVSHGLFAAAENDSRKAELRALAGRLKYQEGQIDIRSGLATLKLPASFRYIDAAGTETLLSGIWGNPPATKKALGTIVPAGFSPFDPQAWCVVINYEEDGYVKDDDAEKINYTKLLKQMKEGTHEASTERVKQGYPAIELVGWETPPRYEKKTHKFYRAKE